MAKPLSDEQMVQVARGLFSIKCENLHKGPCAIYWLNCLIHSVLFSLKLYVPLNVISSLFRIKSWLRQPLRTLISVAKASARSAGVLTGMVLFAKMTICAYVTYFNKADSLAMVIASLGVIPATFIESSAKISDFSLYVMPRFFDAFWKYLKRRGLAKTVPFFQVLLFSLSSGVISWAAFCEEDIIKSTMKNVWQKFLGQN
jgi:hypothetical protein